MALDLGGRAVFLDEPPVPGVGDVVLRSLFRLRELAGGGAGLDLSLSVGVKLPTGDVERLLGSGHADYNLSLILEQRLGPRDFLYGQTEYDLLGALDLLPGLEINDTYEFLTGYEHRFPRWSADLQILSTSSPVARATQTPLGDPGYLATAGIQYDVLPSLTLMAGVIENFLQYQSSLDLGFHLGMVYRVK